MSSYIDGGGDKEFVFCDKSRPFAVLCSKHLPTPATTMIDYNLVMELGLKISDLQCKKITIAGMKLRLLGEISTTVQCVKDGKMFGNIHLRGSVVENLKDAIDSHCIAGQMLSMILSDEISANPMVTILSSTTDSSNVKMTPSSQPRMEDGLSSLTEREVVQTSNAVNSDRKDQYQATIISASKGGSIHK